MYDYECDLTGVAQCHYQHYLEHARHVFLKRRDFTAWFERGIALRQAN
jgi:hypothetical protein